ncbi:hypothetical protein OD800_13305 [Pseudomonas aeruginosa]|uniref:hypothetical protein n=1 Tax=Pseudomonas aeruginosa TaxID=287 RepID=UPI0021F1916B|nr:hypothetical protein [Pseudomonas aeruginosa]MCV4156573.1 hypothetical protein [Pseudomonas aeruginosa]
MHDQISPLSRSASRLLAQAALEINIEELKELVSDCIQYGPLINLDNPLTLIDQATTPPIIWEALINFIGWGAGVITRASCINNSLLYVQSAHLERLLRAISKRLDGSASQGERMLELARKLVIPQVRQSRKPSGSHDLE